MRYLMRQIVWLLLAGEIQFGHLSPAPMLTAWAQGADFVWVGTTTHQMVFTLITDSSITKGADLKGKKIGKLEYGMCRIRVKKASRLHKYVFSLINRIIEVSGSHSSTDRTRDS